MFSSQLLILVSLLFNRPKDCSHDKRLALPTKMRCLLFMQGLVTCLSLAKLGSSDPSAGTDRCPDGLGLNYTLPMFHECRKKLHPNGSLVQTIPKIIPVSSAEDRCPARNDNSRTFGRRLCRFPDCDEDLCENGWCVETMKSYRCICFAGFQGPNCEEPAVSMLTDGMMLEKTGETDKYKADLIISATPSATGFTKRINRSATDPMAISPAEPTRTTHLADSLKTPSGCTDALCENGWCVETMKSYKCYCYAGFHGTHCKERTAVNSSCQDVFRWFEGNLYCYFDERVNFYQALTNCRNINWKTHKEGDSPGFSDLVSIHSDEEMSFIMYLCKGRFEECLAPHPSPHTPSPS
ncbi:neurogenic locus Notch protein-like [Lytechinus variegatus]|uniref:neurogenic locus Notch protein-like n=1 Tax=Lytechinus variegatus TaxID=7654 RepID=UPI001BB1B156|nr:neurogenic locus Notch protein-like [Lytechinus variegatus]